MKIVPRKYRPGVIALIYLVFGVIWILFSDSLSVILFEDDLNQYTNFQRAKGLFYVIVSAVLIYLLINTLYTNLSDSESRLQLVFTNKKLGILKLAKGGDIVYSTNNLANMLGYTHTELLQKNIYDLLPKEDEEKVLTLVRNIEQEELRTFAASFKVLAKDDSLIYVDVNGTIVKSDQSQPHMLLAVNDVTELNEKIAIEQHQKEKLEQIAWMQSHLVRAPIARILGLLELLKQQDEPEVSKESTELFALLEESVQEMDQITRNITQKSREERLEES